MAEVEILTIDVDGEAIVVPSDSMTAMRGPTGPVGPVGVQWQGAWSGAIAYVVNDLVSYNQQTYISILAGTNKTPVSEPTYWSLLAAKGADGVGTVTTVAEGTGIDVNSGDPANPIVSIEAGVYRAGGTDVAVADGGTGSSTASGARTNLGLVIGTNVEAEDADLTAIAALTSAADKVPYATGAQAWALATLTSFARTLIDDVDAATARATLGLVIGTNVQAQDAELAALAGLTSDADRLPYFTGSGTAALAVFTAAGRALIDDADAAAQRTTLGAAPSATFPVLIGVALSDETTAITTGTNKATIRAPFAFTLTGVRAYVNTVSSSGLPTVDINKNATTVLSTKLTIDASEKTSVTAATPAVISVSSLADDDSIEFDIDVAGTGAKGLKVWLIGTRVLS